MSDTESGPPPRRTPRDWAVDVLLFLVAVVFLLVMSEERWNDPHVPDWLLTVDEVAAWAGCAALWLRRRWPVAVAVALVPLSTFSELVAGAQMVALFTVAVHRPVKVTAAVVASGLVAAPVYVLLRPEPGVPGGLLIVIGLLITAAVVGWGLFIRHRRQLVLSLRERAARAETEARLRAEHAQHLAREEIAREMHDVLGHRLSLLSVHAGALEYHRAASADEVARTAGVIRENAHQALQDLREVIGVLRAPVGELPQPTLADVSALVDDSGRAGMRVDLRTDVTGDAPASVGRTAYRIVQEGLTNVRRHAPGAQVCVAVTGAPGDGLTVEVRDTGAARGDTGDGVTGAAGGHGLVGLAERAALAGGRLEHGPVAGGGFALSAWLPWPA